MLQIISLNEHGNIKITEIYEHITIKVVDHIKVFVSI